MGCKTRILSPFCSLRLITDCQLFQREGTPTKGDFLKDRNSKTKVPKKKIYKGLDQAYKPVVRDIFVLSAFCDQMSIG